MPFFIAAGAAALGAGVSGGIGLLGSQQQSNAVKSGSREANLLQLIALDRTRGDLQPYNAAGQGALGPAGMASGATGEDNALFDRNTALRMSGVLGPEAEAGAPVQNIAGQLSGIYGPEAAQAAMANFQTSPGYQWRLDQGMRAVDAQQAARGMLRSGATLKAEQAYAQGLASDEYNKYLANADSTYGNYYKRADSAFGDYYTRLANLATMGQNAAAQQGTATQATGLGMANTAASAAGAQAGIAGNLTSSLGSAVNGLFNNRAVQDQVKSWLAPSVPFNPAGGLSYQAGTSPGYGDQLFQSGGVF